MHMKNKKTEILFKTESDGWTDEEDKLPLSVWTERERDKPERDSQTILMPIDVSWENQ